MNYVVQLYGDEKINNKHFQGITASQCLKVQVWSHQCKGTHVWSSLTPKYISVNHGRINFRHVRLDNTTDTFIKWISLLCNVCYWKQASKPWNQFQRAGCSLKQREEGRRVGSGFISGFIKSLLSILNCIFCFKLAKESDVCRWRTFENDQSKLYFQFLSLYLYFVSVFCWHGLLSLSSLLY